MANILFSAYWCSPYGFSEHVGSFRWLEVLIQKHNLLVFTSKKSEKGIYQYYSNKLPSNLTIRSFEDENFFSKNFKGNLHFGFFTYNKNVKRYIRNNPEIHDNFDVVLHKSPSSFRYRTNIYLVNAPLLLGPLGGGLQVPKLLKEYFKKESRIQKLRVFDKLLFFLPSYKKLYSKTKKILISFDYLKSTLPSRYHNKTITILNTGVQINREYVEREKQDGQVVNLLFVGRLARYKGAELAIRAIAQLKVENFHFDIVGGGGEIEHLKMLSKKMNVADKITFHGKIPREKVESFYQKADIFCFPSITEAGGNVFLEAMSHSLPIISVNNGGPKYLCPDGGTLRVSISKPGEMVDEIANHLNILICSCELRKKMGKINYEHCKANYSWDVMNGKILSLFE